MVAIEVGQVGRPEPGRRDADGLFRIPVVAGRRFDRRGDARDHAAFGVHDFVDELERGTAFGGVGDGRIDVEPGRGLAHLRRTPVDCGYVDGLRNTKPHVAIDAAVKGDVGFDGGRNVRAVDVVDFHRQDIGFGSEADVLGDVELEAGVAAFVVSDAASVHPELRDLVHAFEFQEDALAAEVGVELKVFAIPADAAEVAGDFVAAVQRVPGVRKIDPLPGGVVERGPRSVSESGFDSGAGGRVAIPGAQFASAVLLATE